MFLAIVISWKVDLEMFLSSKIDKILSEFFLRETLMRAKLRMKYYNCVKLN